jgi:hypothetical protein
MGVIRCRSAVAGVQVSVAPRKRMAYLPQQAEIDRSFPDERARLRVAGLLEQPWGPGVASPERLLLRVSTVRFKRSGWRVLSNVAVGSLSSGQFQRVLFARMLVQEAAPDSAGRAVQRHGLAHDGSAATDRDPAVAPRMDARWWRCCTTTHQVQRALSANTACWRANGWPGVTPVRSADAWPSCSKRACAGGGLGRPGRDLPQPTKQPGHVP